MASPNIDKAPGSERAWPGPTKVQDLMTTALTTVGPHETSGFALELMLWASTHHLPVVEDDMFMGIVSDRDLLSARSPQGPASVRRTLVRDIMTIDVLTAAPTDDIASASARMVSSRINCLPVLDDGKLVGILTSSDILAERGRLLFKAGKADVPAAGGIMSAEPRRVLPSTELADAIGQMIENGIRHLPVVNENGKLVGMLSERDLRNQVGGTALPGEKPKGEPRTVAEVMNPCVVTCAADASLFELAGHFIDERIGAVAVVDEADNLTGIVSYIDMLMYLLGDAP